jgi:hypothetical protein
MSISNSHVVESRPYSITVLEEVCYTSFLRQLFFLKKKKKLLLIPLRCYRTLHCGHCRMTLEGLPILYTARFEPPKCSRNRVDPERNGAGAAPVFSSHCPCSIHNQKCNNLFLKGSVSSGPSVGSLSAGWRISLSHLNTWIRLIKHSR